MKVEGQYDSKYPKEIRDLLLPSGFDSKQALKLVTGNHDFSRKTTLRIADFRVSEGFYRAIRDREIDVISILKGKIAAIQRYQLLSDDQELTNIIKEQNKLGDDAFLDDGTISMGNLQIASYILSGSITQSYPEVKQFGGHFLLKVSVEVNLTITDATTGEIEFTKTIVASEEEKLFVSAEGMIIQGLRNLTNRRINSFYAVGEDIDLGPQYRKALDNALSQAVKFFQLQYPVIGEVVSVNTNEVISTAALGRGVWDGDYLFLIRLSEPLKNSSGEVVGVNKEIIGTAEVVFSERDISTAKIIRLKREEVVPRLGDIVVVVPR